MSRTQKQVNPKLNYGLSNLKPYKNFSERKLRRKNKNISRKALISFDYEIIDFPYKNAKIFFNSMVEYLD